MPSAPQRVQKEIYSHPPEIAQPSPASYPQSHRARFRKDARTLALRTEYSASLLKTRTTRRSEREHPIAAATGAAPHHRVRSGSGQRPQSRRSAPAADPDGAEQDRFPTPGASNEPENFARLNVQRNAIEHGATIETDDQVSNADDGFGIETLHAATFRLKRNRQQIGHRER